MKIDFLVPVFVRQSADGQQARWEVVMGEPTDVPGLAVIPELAEAGRGYSGRWRIAHAPSGGAVGPAFTCPRTARARARRLAGLVAWSSVTWPVPPGDTVLAERIDRALADPPPEPPPGPPPGCGVRGREPVLTAHG